MHRQGQGGSALPVWVKASIVTTNSRTPGSQFVLHAKALPGNPYDRHTLGHIIETTEKLTDCTIERAYVDKGYRGHTTERQHRVFISGQKRGGFGIMERELRRRSAIEPIIRHMKSDGHRGRCHFKGHEGDAIDIILTAVGRNLAASSVGRGFYSPQSWSASARQVASSAPQTGLLTDDLSGTARVES
jgi:transposase, IS5 family